MKTTIKALLILLIVSCATTKLTEEQKLKQLFTTELTAYGNDFNNENWSGVADRMYARLFDYMPKAKMIEMFEGMKESGMEMKFGAIKLDRLSEVVIHENEKFCKVDYLSELTIKISGNMLKIKWLMSDNFKDDFGKENVIFDDKTKSFRINSIKSMLAISPKDENNWKFIEFNKSKTRMLKKLVSEDILNRIASEIEEVEMVEEETIIDSDEEMEEEEPAQIENIFTVIQKNAQFPGGEGKLYEFIIKTLKYPEEAKKNNIYGRVHIQFIVEIDGSLTDIKVLRGLGSGCDEEAIRLVKSMPKWEPGELKGEKVKVRFNLPINFRVR